VCWLEGGACSPYACSPGSALFRFACVQKRCTIASTLTGQWQCIACPTYLTPLMQSEAQAAHRQHATGTHLTQLFCDAWQPLGKEVSVVPLNRTLLPPFALNLGMPLRGHPQAPCPSTSNTASPPQHLAPPSKHTGRACRLLPAACTGMQRTSCSTQTPSPQQPTPSCSHGTALTRHSLDHPAWHLHSPHSHCGSARCGGPLLQPHQQQPVTVRDLSACSCLLIHHCDSAARCPSFCAHARPWPLCYLLINCPKPTSAAACVFVRFTRFFARPVNAPI